MKRGLLLFFAIAASMAITVQAAEPKLSKGILLQANDKPIDAPVGHLVPRVLDWNGDGKKDLIVGQFSEGLIRVYLNQGTDADPRFGNPTDLQAGGKVIHLSAG